MSKLIAAHTPATVAPFPPYINVSREDDGTVVVTLRGDSTEHFERDRGKGGRCVPGHAGCNNYCNMHPNRRSRENPDGLPMADAPEPFHWVNEGPTVSAKFSAKDWEAFSSALAESNGAKG